MAKHKPNSSAPASEQSARSSSLPWTAVFGLLTALLVVLSWFPLLRLTAKLELGPNEGFDSYFEQAAATGSRIYGESPKFIYANYPPLSFHLVGLIGRITGDVNFAGRLISVGSWLAIGLFIAMIVERLTGVRRSGMYAGLCWLIWLAAFDMNRIGFNDPHLLAVAFGTAAFYFFLRDESSPRWLCLSAAMFAASLFTKHTLIAFPLAVGIRLVRTDRKRFLLWAATLGGSCGVLLLFTLLFDGSHFLEHLALSRTFSLNDLAASTAQYLIFVQIPFLAALVWILRQGPSGPSNAIVWSFAASHVIGTIATGGNGAGVNHFFDGMIATAIIVGLLLPMPEKLAAASLYPRLVLTILLVVPFFLSSLLVLPGRIGFDIARYQRGVPALEAEFLTSVQLIKSQPGHALCENLLLCFEAGKPQVIDAFATEQAIKTGHLQESELLQALASRSFGIVEIEASPSEVLRPTERHRFSAAFMKGLLSNYRLALRNSRYAIFVPNP